MATRLTVGRAGRWIGAQRNERECLILRGFRCDDSSYRASSAIRLSTSTAWTPGLKARRRGALPDGR